MAIDKELADGINLMLKGEEAGFNILYSHTYNYVYGRTRLIMKNEEDALDLTQETYIQAYKGIRSLEDPNNVFAWLGAIAYRQGMLALRKKRDVLVSEDAEGIFDIVESTDAELQPEESAEAKATSQVVMDMINELPELQRAAVMAYYYDEMRVEDIATTFDCSAGTIKSRLNYARKFLKEKVMEHEKKNRYKLCSVSPAIIIMAIKALLAKKEYKMAYASINSIYAAACSAVGLTPSLVAVGVGATAVVGTSAAASATGSVVTAAITKAGMAIGTKIVIAIASVAAVGTIGTAAIMHNKNNNELPTTTPVVVEATTTETPTSDASTKETNNEAQAGETTATEVPTSATHVHDYTEVIMKEATCTAEGVKTFTCECGDSYTKTIPAAGHSHESVITREKTCDVDGVLTYTCACGDSFEAPLAATGHSFGAYAYNNDATYLADGTETAKCSVCGAEDIRTSAGTKKNYTYTYFDEQVIMFVSKKSAVRSIPSEEGEKLAEYSPREMITVGGKCNENGWYRVEYKDGNTYKWGYLNDEDMLEYTFKWLREDMYSTGDSVGRATPSSSGKKVYTTDGKGDLVRVYAVCEEIGWYFVEGYGDGNAEYRCFMAMADVTSESPWEYREDGFVFYFGNLHEAPYLVNHETLEPVEEAKVYLDETYNIVYMYLIAGSEKSNISSSEAMSNYLTEKYGPCYEGWEYATNDLYNGIFSQMFEYFLSGQETVTRVMYAYMPFKVLK